MIRIMNCCIVALLCLLFVCRSDAADRQDTAISKARDLFEAEVLDMAYYFHAAQNRHDEALKVAEQAIKAKQVDPEWRRKAACSAELAGRPDRALTYWLYLAEHGDGTARQSALRLSRSMNEFPVRRYLLEGMLLSGNDDPDLLKEYLAVSEALGSTSEAYDLLVSRLVSGNRELMLKEQARLAEMLGKPGDAANALNKLALIRPLTPDETMQRAKLMLGQGDLKRAWQTSHGTGPDKERLPAETAADSSHPQPDAKTLQTVSDPNQHQEPAVTSESRRGFTWGAATRRPAERRYFQIDPPTAGGMIRYEFNQDIRTVSGQTTTDSSHTVTERIDLVSKGFIYHPALLEFNLKFSPEFRQNIQNKSEISGTNSSNGNSVNPNFQANAVVLSQKPYTLTLFAQHLEAQSWATYTGVTKITTDNYGADVALKYSLLPTTFGFSSSTAEQGSYFGTSNEWQEVHLLSRHRGVTGDSSLTSAYSVNKQVTNGVANEIKTLNNTFSNIYQVTDDDRVSLASNLQQMNQDSHSLQNTSLQVAENLTWHHRKNLRSQYAFNYRQVDTGTTTGTWTSLDGRLAHKLYENLTTTVGATGAMNSYTGGREKALTGLLNTAYQRTLGTWGVLDLTAGVTHLYTSRTGAKGAAQVSNEPHALNSMVETFLDKPDINTGSIIVTNSGSTIIFVKDVDYLIDVIGTAVRISRLPLGAITDGQLLLISYSYTRDAGYDDSVLTQNYGISLELKRSLFLSYRYQQAKQTLLAGPPPDRLSNSTLHLATIRYDVGWSETGAIFEDNNSNADVSYLRWEVNETFRVRPNNWFQYSLRGYYGETDYRSHADLKKTYGATTNLNWMPLNWLRFELEGYLEQVDGTLERTTNSGARSGVEMSYRLWTVRLNYKLSEQNNKLSDYSRSNHVVQMEINRAVW